MGGALADRMTKLEKNLVFFKDWSSRSLGLSLSFSSPNLGLVSLREARMTDLALNWYVTSRDLP